jgi:predicted permease
LRAVSPGFDPGNVQVAEFSLGSEKYKASAPVGRFVEDVLTRLRSLPGGSTAAVSLSVPYRRGLNTAPRVSAECNSREIEYRPISAGYFSLLHVPVLQGREFVQQESAPVAIVNEAFLRQCRPDAITVGSQVTEMWEKFPRQVVGVVGDTKTYGLARRAPAMIYVPISQVPDVVNSYINKIFSWSVLLRTSQQQDLSRALEQAIESADPELPVRRIHSLSDALHDSLASARLTVLLVGAFAAMALLLTSLGIYGLLSYFVTQRTQEIGVRLALGATQDQVLKLVVSEGMLLVGIGTVAGLAGAFAATRLMSSLVFGVRPTDPITFVAALLFLLCVALLASYIPARRAARIDPVVALRYE